MSLTPVTRLGVYCVTAKNRRRRRGRCVSSPRHKARSGRGAPSGKGSERVPLAGHPSREPGPDGAHLGLQDTVNPPHIDNHIWYNYLDKRSVESSYWLLPTAGHYPQRDEPEEMAGIVRTCLEVGIPAPEEEDAFMRTLARNRTATSPVYMGRSIIENVYFPGAVAYSPDGYSF